MKGDRIKKFTAMLTAMALLLSLSVSAVAVETEPFGGEIVIYHTNDIHGAVTYAEGGSMGLDRVAAMKTATPGSILVDAGDATQGVPFASLSKGAGVIDAMNAAGYDVMAAGNHEFDYGTEVFLSNAAAAEFPVLAANVFRDGVPLLDGGCHTLIERNGVQIGFFGLTTADTATSTDPAGIKGLVFRDELETAKEEIDALEAAGADVVIAIAHVGEYDNIVPWTSAELAAALTGEYAGRLDAIIDGHSHTVENEFVNGTLIVQTGTGLTNLGKITLDFGSDDVLDGITGEVLSAEEVAAAVEPAADVTKKLETTTASMMALLAQPLGESETTLWGGTVGGVAEARFVETNLGSFAADAYREAGERFIKQAAGMEDYQGLPVIGAENGGGLRASIPAGPVTKGDLISIFPFSNTLMLKEISPQLLYETLEVSVSKLTGQDIETGLLSGDISGGFLQVSGIRFTYDPAAQTGSKVKTVTLEADGKALDRGDTQTRLLLVSNNFIMNGGSGHSALAECPLVGEIGGELETVEAYFTAQAGEAGLPALTTKGRIVPDAGYVPKAYAAHIRVETAAGQPAANQAVTYYLDNRAAAQATTDASGLLTITVPDGPHGVRLYEAGAQVYINNYSGAGTVETEYRGFPVLQLKDSVAGFSDVAAAHAFYDGISYVVDKGIMQGYGGGIFAPEDTLTRAQAAQIFYNMAGKPETAQTLPFSDVSEDAWYAEAVAWEAQVHVVEGYGDVRFGPEDKLTREQMIWMLERYAQYQGETSAISKDGDPKEFITRAQAAQMLYLFCGQQPK